MYDIKAINSAVSRDRVVAYLCHRLGTTAELDGTQTRIKGQGGLFVDEQCRLARPGDGEGAGGAGILSAVIFCETGGQWTADKDTFKICLAAAAQEAGFEQQQEKPPPAKRAQPKEKPPVDFNKPTKIYSYTDESGVELYQNCRYEWKDKNGKRLKTFRQRRNVDGKWIFTLEGVRHVPYALQELLSEPDMICDVEGEKDVETLKGIGLTATNMAKLKDDEFKEFAKIAKSKTVAVFEDNDKPGKESAERRCRFWYKAGADVKKISFPEMSEKADVTDWMNADNVEHDIFELLRIINSSILYHPLADIIIDFRHEPTKRAPVISMHGQHIVSEGEISGFTAPIGAGKSHLIEMIAALAIDPTCEPESHLDVSLQPGEKCILIDTERTDDDCYYGLKRMWRRTGQKPGTLTTDKSRFNQFIFVHTSHLSKPDRLERLAEAIETPGLKLLLIDGATDFVKDPNSSEECNNFAVFLHQQANKHKIAIFYSLQGNRNDDSGKGKGWLGAELQQKSAAFLRLKKHPNNPDIRVFTTDFDNVKVRNGKDSGLTLHMMWDDDLHGFKCIPCDEQSGDKPSEQELFAWCFAKIGKDLVSRSELVKVLC